VSVRDVLGRYRLPRRLRRAWFRYQRRRPPRCPRGWRTGPPDFVGLGVQKAGTTWWYDLITRHPGVSHRGRPKELNFLSSFWERPFGAEDAARYARYFTRPRGKLAGEWAPGYLYHFWAVPALTVAAPQARLLVLLRDPVERYRSGLLVNAELWTLDATQSNDAFQRGLYASQLARLYRYFPPEQVLVLQYERCITETRSELARTYRFLGLDDAFEPDDATRPVNPTRFEKMPLAVEPRRELVAAYEPEVERLCELTSDVDVSLWPNFRHLKT
jgi:hypothetical protein